LVVFLRATNALQTSIGVCKPILAYKIATYVVSEHTLTACAASGWQESLQWPDLPVGATLRLADFIKSEKESILQEWEAFARTLEPAASAMDDVELRDHAALMLDFIADDLVTFQSIAQQIEKSKGHKRRREDDAGEDHGLARLHSKFTIEQLCAEYRALRSSVLRLWGQAHPKPDSTGIEDIVRFNEVIDQLLAASVFVFADAERKALADEKKQRNQFLAMLAHELRNPLAPIDLASALLANANGNEKIIQSTSNVIRRQVAHMATLVDDLLDVSRVTQGLITFKVETLDLQETLDNAVEQVTPQIQARGHQFNMAGPLHPTLIQGDKKRLVQVVTNLLTNAAKYTPEGGRIDLRSKVQGSGVVISVEDNGVGMTAEFMKRAFDSFAQVEQTSDRTTGGLGLGLALVKSLVEMHGGTVTCSSKGLGEGSCFIVELPQHQKTSENTVNLHALLERRRSSSY
jgi:signal transduction histidine kinase